MRTPEPSSSKADVDHLQEVGSETEETGGSGTGELVSCALEDSSRGGCLWCHNGANGGTSGSWGGCSTGL